MNDTIAAISTNVVTNNPISIIRISGSDAFSIVKKIFDGKIGKHQTITYGFIKEQETKVDEVLISWFFAPNTFTGENLVEINAHGGIVNTQRILGLLLANGARLAKRGEFSRRAFLNNKMDLIKAEAIHDLIFSKTQEQAKFSVKKFDGQTSKLIHNLQNKILKIIATIETNIDYPEYDDIEVLTQKTLLPKLKKIKKEFDEIISSSKSSRYIFKGVDVAIIGKPNAGKSSLLNAILNEEKAIVTHFPGTTRDVVEGSIQIGQVLLNFKDTAGIHITKNLIENIGVKKSIKEIQDANLIIHLIDGQEDADKNDNFINQKLKNKNYLKVYNKSDIIKKDGINISAKNGEIKSLINAIKNIYKDIDLNNNKIINNTRQLSLIISSKNSVEEAIKGLENKFEPSVVIIDIQKAWEDLGNILGQVDSVDLLDKMFKTFCLGK